MEKKRDAKRWWMLSTRECRAVLLLLPLLAAIVWIAAEAFRPKFDDTALLLGDMLTDQSVAPVVNADRGQGVDQSEVVAALFPFDPNTVSYEELRELGIAKGVAAGIIKYREAGKVFRIPEDFASCYGISDSMYAALKPYVVIGEAYRIQKRKSGYDPARRTPERERTPPAGNKLPKIAPFDPNALSAEGFVELGFSPRQAAVIVNFRRLKGGFRTAEELAECYVVSSDMYDRLKAYIVIGEMGEERGGRSPKTGVPQATQPAVVRAPATAGYTLVEINGADSAALVGVRGIGAKSAEAIIAYRNRLGGYHNAGQVRETGIVTERNWELMEKQIWADSCVIRKIDINFATPETVARHPYFNSKMLRKVLRNRQLRGGWSTIEDMIEDHTLTTLEAKKLAPYLHFGTQPR